MNAGKLDRIIRIERAHRVPGVAGSETIVWTSVATMRAELLEAEASEARDEHGVRSKATLAFRLRFFPGITPDDRLIYDNRLLNIRSVKEIGRRRGLEIHAVAP